MDILPDLLDRNLKVIFCGTAVGKQSAERQAYYSGDGNKVWPILCSIAITDRLLEPSEYKDLLSYRVGLTDLAKTVSGSDSKIKPSDYDPARLRWAIETYKPFALAFTSKTAGQSFFDGKRNYGQQPDMIGTTRTYILPSTSGLANAYWSKDWWVRLAADIRDQ